MTYKIEKDIPMPMGKSPNPKGRPRSSKFPFKDMEVGDSFLISDPKDFIPSLNGQLQNVSFRLGMKVRTKKTSKGLRVWRVK